jgi:hypothetical protein
MPGLYPCLSREPSVLPVLRELHYEPMAALSGKHCSTDEIGFAHHELRSSVCRFLCKGDSYRSIHRWAK